MTLAEIHNIYRAGRAVAAWLACNPGWKAKLKAQKGGFVDVELWKPPFTAVVGTFANAEMLIEFLEQKR